MGQKKSCILSFPIKLILSKIFYSKMFCPVQSVYKLFDFCLPVPNDMVFWLVHYSSPMNIWTKQMLTEVHCVKRKRSTYNLLWRYMLVNQLIYQKYFLLQAGLDSSQSHALYYKPSSSRVINKQYSFIRWGFCDIQNNHPITISRRDVLFQIIWSQIPNRMIFFIMLMLWRK